MAWWMWLGAGTVGGLVVGYLVGRLHADYLSYAGLMRALGWW